MLPIQAHHPFDILPSEMQHLVLERISGPTIQKMKLVATRFITPYMVSRRLSDPVICDLQAREKRVNYLQQFEIAGAWLERLDLKEKAIAHDEFLKIIATCPNLTHINLKSNADLTKKTYKAIIKLTKLVSLELPKKIDQTHLPTFPTTLTNINAQYCDNLDSIMPQFTTQLRSLDLRSVKYTESKCVTMLQRCTNIQTLAMGAFDFNTRAREVQVSAISHLNSLTTLIWNITWATYSPSNKNVDFSEHQFITKLVLNCQGYDFNENKFKVMPPNLQLLEFDDAEALFSKLKIFSASNAKFMIIQKPWQILTKEDCKKQMDQIAKDMAEISC